MNRTTIYADPGTGDYKVPGYRMAYFYLDGDADEINGNDIFKGNGHALSYALKGISFVSKIVFSDKTEKECFVYVRHSKKSGCGLEGRVFLISDIEAVKRCLCDIKSFPEMYTDEKCYLESNHKEFIEAVDSIITENSKTLLDRVKESFNSIEGIEHTKKFMKKLALKSSNASKWEKKIYDLIKDKSEVEIDTLASKFFEWEIKLRERYYQNGVESCSNIFSRLDSVVMKHGTEIDSDEDFYSGGAELHGYGFKTYCGQGCFTRVIKDNETVC